MWPLKMLIGNVIGIYWENIYQLKIREEKNQH